MAAFAIPDLIDEVMSELEPIIKRSNLTVSTRIQGRVPQLRSDRQKVKQIVLNLLSNALKFTRVGSVTLRATAQQAKGGRLAIVLAVQDTGAGIAPGDLARIFGAFEQSELGQQAGGTGLGLPISREFARLMDGDLVATSVLGQGSQFVFSFLARPAAAPVAQPVSGPVPLRLAAGQAPRRILVADDVATNRELLVELLRPIGFDTRAVGNGEEALRACAWWRPHLLLMDLHMPRMDGFEVARRLRETGAPPAIFLLSASGVGDTEAAARTAGIDDFLRKPYREAELLDKIAARLGVRYEYAGAVPGMAEDAAADTVDADLASLLGGLPQELRDELRAASLAARAKRLDELAERAKLHSEAAAARIHALARGFRYDLLLDALGAQPA
jgi:CheY-like chemotaxis protein